MHIFCTFYELCKRKRSVRFSSSVSLTLNNLKTGTCLSWLCCSTPAGDLEKTCILSRGLCIKLCCKTQKVKIKILCPERDPKYNKIGFCVFAVSHTEGEAKIKFLLIISMKQMTFMFLWYCLALGKGEKYSFYVAYMPTQLREHLGKAWNGQTQARKLWQSLS